VYGALDQTSLQTLIQQPNSDMSWAGIEPRLPALRFFEDVHSTKELSRQLTHVTILIRYMATPGVWRAHSHTPDQALVLIMSGHYGGLDQRSLHSLINMSRTGIEPACLHRRWALFRRAIYRQLQHLTICCSWFYLQEKENRIFP
jgi:hypothetical protein